METLDDAAKIGVGKRAASLTPKTIIRRYASDALLRQMNRALQNVTGGVVDIRAGWVASLAVTLSQHGIYSTSDPLKDSERRRVLEMLGFKASGKQTKPDSALIETLLGEVKAAMASRGIGMPNGGDDDEYQPGYDAQSMLYALEAIDTLAEAAEFTALAEQGDAEGLLLFLERHGARRVQPAATATQIAGGISISRPPFDPIALDNMIKLVPQSTRSAMLSELNAGVFGPESPAFNEFATWNSFTRLLRTVKPLRENEITAAKKRLNIDTDDEFALNIAKFWLRQALEGTLAATYARLTANSPATATVNSNSAPCTFCSGPAKQRCSTCYTGYCCKECQCADWENGHSDVCEQIAAGISFRKKVLRNEDGTWTDDGIRELVKKMDGGVIDKIASLLEDVVSISRTQTAPAEFTSGVWAMDFYPSEKKRYGTNERGYLDQVWEKPLRQLGLDAKMVRGKTIRGVQRSDLFVGCRNLEQIERLLRLVREAQK